MLVVQRGGGTCYIVVDGAEFEGVQMVKYLVSMFNVMPRLKTELRQQQEWWRH